MVGPVTVRVMWGQIDTVGNIIVRQSEASRGLRDLERTWRDACTSMQQYYHWFSLERMTDMKYEWEKGSKFRAGYILSRTQPLAPWPYTQMSAIFHIRQANPKGVVCIIFLYSEFRGQDIILQLIIDLVRFDVIVSIEETNPCRRHTRKSQNQPRLPHNLCVILHVYDPPSSSEYRRISFTEIYSKPPSFMHCQCSHLPGPVPRKLLVNQLAWPCISSTTPHGQVDQDYT